MQIQWHICYFSHKKVPDSHRFNLLNVILSYINLWKNASCITDVQQPWNRKQNKINFDRWLGAIVPHLKGFDDNFKNIVYSSVIYDLAKMRYF